MTPLDALLLGGLTLAVLYSRRLQCALAPGGHPGTVTVRRRVMQDCEGVPGGERPVYYSSRLQCSRCGALVDALEPVA